MECCQTTLNSCMANFDGPMTAYPERNLKILNYSVDFNHGKE